MSLWKRFSYAWKNADNVNSLYQELDTVRREMRRLKALNQDQDKQIRELIGAHPMTDLQLEEIALIRKDNDEMRREQNLVIIYLRTRFPADFQSGRHGSRTFGEIVISYMSRVFAESEAPHAKAPL